MTDDTKPQAVAITVLCEECGQLLEVKDPAALIRSLHVQNACAPMQQVLGEPAS